MATITQETLDDFIIWILKHQKLSRCSTFKQEECWFEIGRVKYQPNELFPLYLKEKGLTQ